MIGMTLVTHQTGPEGRVVSRVLVEEGVAISRELYLSVLIDRAVQRPLLMASEAGGMDIEEVAASTPERIVREHIHPGVGLTAFQARKVAFALGLEGAQVQKATKVMQAIYRCFLGIDASLIEVNPLIVTGSGDLLALDAKITSTTTRSPGTPASASCATSPKKTRSRSRRRSSR
jgi:succinyl-CoA synthetase beta subunit